MGEAHGRLMAGQRPSRLTANGLIVEGRSTTQSGQAQGRKAALSRPSTF